MHFESNLHIETVGKAFSKKSVYYDEYDQGNSVLRWMRERIRNRVLSLLKPESSILELNAGTGMDAVYFASKGHRVYATDVAEGMVQKIKEKIITDDFSGRLYAERRSFTDLIGLPEKEFDCIFSNFGGLNCVEDIEKVVSQFSKLLKKNGVVVMAIMPPVCPWELFSVFRGKFNLAFRRLRKGGTKSHLEGEYFLSYYPTPSKVIKAFGKDFEVEDLTGMCSLVPPSYAERFPKVFPRLLNLLMKMEERLSGIWPFTSWGDYYILSMRYNPK